MAHSKRMYTILGWEGSVVVTQQISLQELFSDSGGEMMYALQEDIDDILDIQVGETIYVNLSRDDRNSLGVLRRVV